MVIFTESDEILYGYNQRLDDLIESFRVNENIKYLTSIGYEVMQDLGTENHLSVSDLIIPNRNYWFRYTQYDKTLISKMPLKWQVGFHHCNYPKSFGNLFMMHLHRVDFELMLERHHIRANKWNLKKEDVAIGWGTYHGVGDREKLLDYFNTIPSPKELIPQEHRNSVYGL